jgi:hypothetical protein
MDAFGRFGRWIKSRNAMDIRDADTDFLKFEQ